MSDNKHPYEKDQIDLIFSGNVDFVEAGDCTIPGLPESLRVSASGDADKPLNVYCAALSPNPNSPEVVKMTIIDAISVLVARKAEIAKTKGAKSKIFTIKLRKQYSI